MINDRYEIKRRLGSGGMGEVWLAYDCLLGRNVAVKFVGEKELRETPEAHKILRDEAKAAGGLLGCPQVVSVLDLLEACTEIHQGPALVMEYVEGCNVAEWIGTYAPQLDETTRHIIGLYITLETIQAIQAAHARGILHRDIKPGNILLSVTGRVKVADFGLARVVEAITRTHTVWGKQTPLYAAPEQWRGEKPGMQTDIYQLCATVYHLLAGRPANQGSSLLSLLHWHESGELTSLSELAPSLDRSFADEVCNGLSPSPEDRSDLWEIFDTASVAFMKRLDLYVNVEGCSEDKVALIEKITDLEFENSEGGAEFPHAPEAAQEAIAAVLMGANCRLSFASDAEVEEGVDAQG
ncbi:hypothetical protein BSA16_11730 [Micromonospora sp. Rc5]|nr:serine/threonine-protein kinase [Micromonospora sp. DH15]OON31272.1 hypothetical protein BSA16_11730 [Micromonospora sp. Rc5]